MQTARPLTIESVWPNPTQQLLLRAALFDSRLALESFGEWKQASGFRQYSDVDFLATHLLAAVYGNLTRANLSDPWLAQMAGLHRYHLAKNAARQRTLLQLAERLNDLHLQFVVIGGFALFAGQYLNDLGERPFLDADLLLAPADAPTIRRSLQSLGWAAASTAPPIAGWRAESWRGPEKQLLELRYQWLPRPYPVVGVGRLLERSCKVDFAGQPIRIPDPADLLAEACIGGRRFQNDAARRFLWVADGVRILKRGANDIDWDRMLSESRPYQTLLPLREALHFLRREFEAPVPADWLDRAWSVAIPQAELRPFYQSIKHQLASPPQIPLRRRPWDGYVAAERAANRSPSATGMLRYLAWRVAQRS